MSVPYTFSTASQSIPLAQLDSNFATPITLGQSTAFLGQTVTTITGLTLANVNITSGNVTISNINVTNVISNNAVITSGTISNTMLTNVTINSVSSAITAAQGGTGLTTLPANNLLLGNGTGSLVSIAPGTNGNVLTSNGTVWLSAAAGAVAGNVTFGNTTVALGGSSSSIGNLTLNNTTINSGSIASGVTAITQAAAANNTAIATTQFVTTAVTSAAVPNSYNTVGTYAMGKVSGSISNPFTLGTTYAAATLGIPSGSGTWRFMGYGQYEQNICGTYYNTILAIRTV